MFGRVYLLMTLYTLNFFSDISLENLKIRGASIFSHDIRNISNYLGKGKPFVELTC